jgi:hypothetical protein
MSSSPRRAWSIFALSIAWAALPACGGCPTSPSESSRARWETELEARTVLPLVPSGNITIKRDVHSFLITAEPDAFATAFGRVLADKERRFGLIRVDRMQRNEGTPFAKGERFQGRYELDRALAADLEGEWKRIFGDLAEDELIEEWLCVIENQHASDYGEVTELIDAPPEGRPHMFRYEYLSGSPIAGSSTFSVEAVTDPEVLAKHCKSEPCALSRLTQIFEYQEQSQSFAFFFATGGLKLHNGVVSSQAEQAASLVPGAAIVETDIRAP